MRMTLLLAASAAALLTACSGEKTAAPAAVEAPKVALGTFGIDTAQMDAAVKPGDDFFKYVNGKWLATFKMPADKVRYGVFDVAARQVRDRRPAPCWMNWRRRRRPPARCSRRSSTSTIPGWTRPRIEARGIEPLKADLDAINAAKTKADIIKLMGNIDYAGPIGMYISPDPADPTKYTVNITQAGLGMPVRDYYLEQGREVRRLPRRLQGLRHEDLRTDRRRRPRRIGRRRRSRSKPSSPTCHWAPEKQRDVQATNNPIDRAGLKKMIPAIDWDADACRSPASAICRTSWSTK